MPNHKIFVTTNGTSAECSATTFTSQTSAGNSTWSFYQKVYVLTSDRISFETFLAFADKKEYDGSCIFEYIFAEKPDDLLGVCCFLILEDFLFNPRAAEFLDILKGRLLRV